MRKSAVLLLILALVGSSVAPFLSVKANPIVFTPPEMVPAPESVYITIRIASPSENALYPNGTINVIFNDTIDGPASISKSLHIISTYQGDWMQDSQWCPFPPGVDISRGQYSFPFLQYNFSINGIPFGEHTLNITANGQGGYWKNGTEYSFRLKKTVSVKFSVSTNPIITVTSLQNATFETSIFPLNFTVDHPVTEMAYCLDGQESVPISGNTTLTGLSNGQHNVTVYATDEFGNTGASGTLFFNVNAPEPSAPLVATSVIAVMSVIAGIGALVFRRKHKQSKEQN